MASITNPNTPLVGANTVTADTCPAESDLLAFASAALPESGVLDVASHLDGCEECLELVVALSRQRRASMDSASRYSIEAPIGQGGMGVILAATDKALDRAVVLKTARKLDLAARHRFEREIRVTARLQHPSIIPVYDGGVLEDGTPFYAMRRVEGQELEACIQDASTPPQRLSLIRAYTDLAEAVAYAHAEGFIHRDLKPRNVLVGPFGETVVLDWGLAKSVDEAAELDFVGEAEDLPQDAELTETGVVMGTPGYLAPEVRRGADASTQSDVYSLGIILRRILTGEHASSLEPTNLKSLRDARAPADLEAIVRRATKADPKDRYPDASALAKDLRRFEAGRLVEARAYTLGDRVIRFVSRHRAAVAIAVLSVVLIVGTTTWTLLKLDAARNNAESALLTTQIAQQRATEEREAAEALIDFALSDLSEELRAAGRSGGLERLASKVDAYYTQRDPTGEGARALRRARAVSISARVAESRAEHELADARWRDTLDLLPSGNVEGADRLRTDAESARALLLAKRGQPGAAIEAAQTAVASATTRRSASGESHQSILNLGVAQSRLMVVLEYAGKPERAAVVAQELLEQLEPLQASERTLVRELRVRAEGMLGRNALLLQDHEAATTHLQRAVEEAEILRRRHPDTVMSLELVATHRFELAQQLGGMGALEEAEHHLIEVVDTFELLCALQPDAVSSVLRLSNARTTLASVHMERDAPERAASLLREDERDLRHLTERAPELETAVELLGFTEVSLARALVKSGRPSEARPEFRRGLARLRGVAGPQSSPGSRARLAYAQLVAGTFHVELAEYEEAIELFTAAHDLRAEGLEDPADPVQALGVAEVAVQLAEARWRNGDREEARALLRQALQATTNAEAAGVPRAVWMVILQRWREVASEAGVAMPQSYAQ